MTLKSSAWPRLVVLGGLFIASVAIAVRMVRPIDSASIGPDAAAPVIHFQRLLAGHQLEGYLSQTAKPLLTAIYGVLYSLTGDWRSVSWAAIVAFAMCVVLGAILAARVGGPLSGAFVAVGFLLSPTLLRDISLAYAVSWALLSWIVAGLAVTAERPRYEIAGIALMFGTLARPETLAIIVAAVGAVVLADVVGRARQRPGPPRSAYLITLGLLALPVLSLHDAALTGDPLFWANTAQNNSEGGNLRGLLQMIVFVGRFVAGLAPLLPLAALGGILLIAQRRWALATGLAAASIGLAVFWVFVGARGTVVSTRYLDPIAPSLVFAAGLGLSMLDVPAIRRWLTTRLGLDLRRAFLPIAVGAVAALAFAPAWPLDRDVLASVAVQRQLHANARRAMAVIRAELGPRPSWQDALATTDPTAPPLVMIPPRLRAQAVVDLDLPLSAVAKSWASGIDPAAGLPAPGTIVYHDRLDDKANARFTLLEIDRPVTAGALRLVPLLADSADGLWVIRVEAAGGS